MTEIKNVTKSENLTNKSFILIENVCYINNFVLYIYSNSERLHKSDNVEISIQNLKVDIKTRYHKPLRNPPSIICIKGKISFDQETHIKEGNIELTLTDDINNSVIMKLRYELSDRMEEAYDFDEFFEEISQIFNKYLNLNNTTKNQDKLDYFLKPHLHGVKNYLTRLNTPIEASYTLKNNYLVLVGLNNKELYNKIYDFKKNRSDVISTKININKTNLSIFWDDEREEWFINKGDKKKIPQKGQLQIVPKNDLNKIHNNKKFSFSRECLVRIKDNPEFKGGIILRQLLDPENIDDIKITKKNIEELIKDLGLDIEYNRLNYEKKIILEELHNYLIIIINGDGGTGKTEIAAFIAILYSLLGKRVLISSEKNRAIDKLYERIVSILKRIQDIVKPINIVRFKAKSHKIYEKSLKKFQIENQIDKISRNIQDHCKYTNDELKKQFLRTFTNRNNIRCLIALTYDIIVSTYGNIGQQKVLSDTYRAYDLNIIEAGSSVTLAQASVGIHNSKKWMILSDEDQIAPIIPDHFLLKQPLLIPGKSEIQGAKKYDPATESLRKSKVRFGDPKYGAGVASLFNEIDGNPKLHHYHLKEQFRIDRNLYEFICDVFKKECHLPSVEINYSSSLGKIPSLFPSKNHIKYTTMKDEEILVQMGIDVSNLVDTVINLREDPNKPIKIGIACTDVESLKKVIATYQQERYGQEILLDKPTYYEDNEIDGIQVVFSSIDNHQECEYHIFILGIVRIKSKFFKKRIYTALTRAHSYVIVYGPQAKGNFSSSGGYLSRNQDLIQKLYEGGI